MIPLQMEHLLKKVYQNTTTAHNFYLYEKHQNNKDKQETKKRRQFYLLTFLVPLAVGNDPVRIFYKTIATMKL